MAGVSLLKHTDKYVYKDLDQLYTKGVQETTLRLIMAVYGYCRVSTLKQAVEGESLEVQQRQIRGYATMHGFDPLEIFVEEGVSGSVPLERRLKGEILIKKLSDGDVLIVPKLDRLFRSALDALVVVEKFKQKGISLHLLDLGGDISGNGHSRLFLTLAAAFAEAERDRIRERISQVKSDQKIRGKYLGGKIPFGHTRDVNGYLEQIPGAEEAISEILTLRKSGNSLRAISQAMKRNGVIISHECVSKILKSKLDSHKHNVKSVSYDQNNIQ
jgi:putative DNA-invertase from lambdoid prophage Rac